MILVSSRHHMLQLTGSRSLARYYLLCAGAKRSIHSTNHVWLSKSSYLKAPGSTEPKALYTFRSPEPLIPPEGSKKDGSNKGASKKELSKKSLTALKGKKVAGGDTDEVKLKQTGDSATSKTETMASTSDNSVADNEEKGSPDSAEQGVYATTSEKEQDVVAKADPEGVERILGESSEALFGNKYKDTVDSLDQEGHSGVSSKELEVSKESDRDGDDDMPLDRYYLDTQKMYVSLKYAGFTDGQADTLMMTVKELMLKTMKEIKEQSVPGWAAENEAYLFEAACSEIRNDIQASRGAQAEQMRSQLSRLQRDLELLQHEMNDLVNDLKSDLEMDVNDRKDSTKADENMILLKIQDLNSKITTDIKSDVKSEIEALRWQATRRGLTGIIFVAGCFLIASQAKKDDKKSLPVVNASPTSVEEYKVPVLYTSEVEEYPDDIKRVDVI